MFTGIIEEIGNVRQVKKNIRSTVLTIEAHEILNDLKIGDSVAVNGVCLTASDIKGTCFTADIMNETLTRTSMAGVTIQNRVNLERALPADGRFGGHIVSGHIDGTGRISGIRRDGIAVWYTIKTTSEIMRYVIEKGSIAIDGISLTVATVTAAGFCVSIIPHTISQTILPDKRIGSLVNLENDMVGKYIEKMIRR